MEHFRQVLLAPCKDFESEDAARREWLDLKILVARHYRHLDSQVSDPPRVSSTLTATLYFYSTFPTS